MGSQLSFTDMVTSSNKKVSREKKVVLIVVVCILMVVVSCNTVFSIFSTALRVGIRMDDSFSLGDKYRYSRDSPQVIVDNENTVIVEGYLLSYGFDDNFVIALMQDHQTRDSVYWIITKKDNECLAFADSASFLDAMNDHGINLSLKEFPRYYKNLGSRELWHRRK